MTAPSLSPTRSTEPEAAVEVTAMVYCRCDKCHGTGKPPHADRVTLTGRDALVMALGRAYEEWEAANAEGKATPSSIAVYRWETAAIAVEDCRAALAAFDSSGGTTDGCR